MLAYGRKLVHQAAPVCLTMAWVGHQIQLNDCRLTGAYMDCRLIAHRGEPACWPENSLNGFRAVLEAGACFVETDVQITSDNVPVLSHDESSLKLTGHDLRIAETALADIRRLPAGQSERFGNRFQTDRIASLADFVALLVQWPNARAFVEIKFAAIEAVGIEAAVDLVLGALGTANTNFIPISFDERVVRLVRRKTLLPVGWVLPEWSEHTRQLAAALAPDYLFVNRMLVPGNDEPLWSGSWRWVAYTANSVLDIEHLLNLGFDLVETDDIRHMADQLSARV